MSGTEHDRLAALLASLPDEAPPADVQARLRAALAAAGSDERSDTTDDDDAIAQEATAPARVLLIHEPGASARSILLILRHRGMLVEHLGTDTEVAELLARPDAIETWDVIVLDLDLPGIDGLGMLRRLRAADRTISIVALANDSSTPATHEALHAEAFSYLRKPMYNGRLIEVVHLAARKTTLVRHADVGAESAALVGNGPSMRALRLSLEQVARSSADVLIMGESGSGKELVARTLHRMSARRDRPFVAINCGALPDGLLASALFGHVGGAFTGAVSAQPSAFVEADGGTLFLDEVGDLPLSGQVRLLRVLQDREVRPIGGEDARSVDVRVLAATHVDLTRAVAAGTFRADLFFRLNVVSVRIPPLRERREDIPAHIAQLIRRYGGMSPPEVSPDALEALIAYHWPGNVRELENVIQGAIASTRGPRIELRSLPSNVLASSRFGTLVADTRVPRESDPDLALTEAKRRAAFDFDKGYLERVLDLAGGSISAAAESAGIDRTNFRRLLERHGVDETKYRK